MIQIRTLFEDKKLDIAENAFLELFNNELKKVNINVEYIGMQMIVKKEYVDVLVEVTKKYLLDIVGIEIGKLGVYGYNIIDDLPDEYAFQMMMHRCCGMDVRGFYHKGNIFVRVGEHLKRLLPTLFHELTHAYIHQNNMRLVDNYPKPTSIKFDFEALMYEADQEEGVCELVSSLMCYHIFNVDQYPSNVDAYWLGWRLSVECFLAFANVLVKKFPDNSSIWVTKISFMSVINHIKKYNNMHYFVKKVPTNEYYNLKQIRLGMDN